MRRRAEYIYAEVCRFREDFSNAFATKSQAGRLRREAFGVRRIPALSLRSVRNSHTAPEYGAPHPPRAVQTQPSYFGLLSGFVLRLACCLPSLFVSFSF